MSLQGRLDQVRAGSGLLLGSGVGLGLGLLLLWPGSPAGVAIALALAGAGAAAALRAGPVGVAEPAPSAIGEPLEMVELPGGTFRMGSKGYDADESPLHEVTVSAFAIGRHPVVQALYREVMGHSPGDPQGDDLPVNNVSWDQAVEFCNLLSERAGRQPCYVFRGPDVEWDRSADGYRLPTEAEWEYAARAGSEAAYCFGEDPAQLGEYAWFAGNAEVRIQPVGRKKANGWGLCDMHGNVWEWCWDFYGDYPEAAARDPAGPSSGRHRVLRGGSFGYGPRLLRSAVRNWDEPESSDRRIGFRCVRGAGRRP